MQSQSVLRHIARDSVYVDLEWGGSEKGSRVRFEGHNVAVAPFGGPVAIARNVVDGNGQLLAARRGGLHNFGDVESNDDDVLRIYNCSGTETLARVSPWNADNRAVVGFEWASDEMLYIIYRNGDVEQFSPCGETVASFNMFEADAERRRRRRMKSREEEDRTTSPQKQASKNSNTTTTTREDDCNKKKHRVLDVSWWSSRDGFVVLTSEVRIWAADIRQINRLHFGTFAPEMKLGPITGVLSGVDAARPPTAMVAIEARHNVSRKMDVLLALWQTGFEGASIATVRTHLGLRGVQERDAPSEQDQQGIMAMPLMTEEDGERPSPVTHLRVHSLGQLVAAVTESGNIVVFTADFSKRLMDFKTSASMKRRRGGLADGPHQEDVSLSTTPRRRKRGGRRRQRSSLKSKNAPLTVCWSGLLFRRQPVLALMWKLETSGLLLLVDVDGTYRWEIVVRDTVLISEVDGFRIVSPSAVEMFQISDTSDVAAILVEASLQNSEDRTSSVDSATSLDYVRPTRLSRTSDMSSNLNSSSSVVRRNNVVDETMLEELWSAGADISEKVSMMERAVIECLRVAMTRFTRSEQQMYVEAAMLGKRWLEQRSRHEMRAGSGEDGGGVEDSSSSKTRSDDVIDATVFRDNAGRRRFLQSVGDCCRQLRLMNVLRDPKIGIPLTPAQLTYLSEHVLIARLARRRLYELAMRLTKHLQRPLDKDAILLQWARDLLDSQRKRRRRRIGTTSDISNSEQSTPSPPAKPARRSSSPFDMRKNSSSSSNITRRSSTKESESGVFRGRSSSSSSSSSSSPPSENRTIVWPRLRGNFERHAFTSYGSAAVVAGVRQQADLCSLLLRHEKSQRIRVASMLLLSSPKYNEVALREAAATPNGFVDTELIVATLLRLQNVIYPVKSAGSADEFTKEYKILEMQQENVMHSLVMAKNMPVCVLDCYVNVLRRSSHGNRLHRLLIKAGRFREAARMFIEKGCRFYVGASVISSSAGDVMSLSPEELDDETGLRKIRRPTLCDRNMTKWRPSRVGRFVTPISCRLKTDRRYVFLAHGQKLCNESPVRADSGEAKALSEYAIALEHQIELLRLQVRWAPKTIGGSVVDALVRLMGRKGEGADGAMKLAEQMRDVFNITARRFERIKVRALARARRWSDLNDLVDRQGEKISGGIAGVVDACLEVEDGKCEAVQYAHRIADKGARFEKMIELCEWDVAALLAVQLGESGVKFLLRQPDLPLDLRSQLTLDNNDDSSGDGGGRDAMSRFSIRDTAIGSCAGDMMLRGRRGRPASTAPLRLTLLFPEDDRIAVDDGCSTPDVGDDLDGMSRRPRSSIFSVPFRASGEGFTGTDSSSQGFFSNILRSRSMPRIGGLMSRNRKAGS